MMDIVESYKSALECDYAECGEYQRLRPDEIALRMCDRIEQYQSELKEVKQEGDAMWDGLNDQIAELQAKNKELEKTITEYKFQIKEYLGCAPKGSE